MCFPGLEEILSTHKVVKQSGLPNYLGARIPIETTLNVDFLTSALQGYEDDVITEFFKFGWPINTISEPKCANRLCGNHKSASNNPKAIQKFVQKGLADNSILGPLNDIPFNKFVVSPLGSVPKSDPSERRTIMNLSYPKGASVNDVIPKDSYLGQSFHLRYPGVDQLINLIKLKGQGCALFKRDLKSAYRQLLRVDPGDIHWLGFSWNNKFYFDLTHPQGGRSAAMCCQRATSGIVYIFKSMNPSNEATNYLDDFAGAEVWEDGQADRAYSELGLVLENANILEAMAKSCPPSTIMVFLGILFDTVSMTISITAERLLEITGLLKVWLNKFRATKKEVQSIVGLLNFVAACVRPGRIFLARMFVFLGGMSDKGSCRLSAEFQKDIFWWDQFMVTYNGVSMINIDDWGDPDEVLSCDACLSGAGGWFAGSRSYFHVKFPPEICEAAKHINGLELVTVCVCCKLWGPELTGKRIQIFCDNDASVQVIKSGRSTDAFMQSCVRELFYWCAKYQFEIRATHIYGVDNRIPDRLSRWHLSDFHGKEFFKLVGEKPVFESEDPTSLFQFSCPW